MLWGQMHSYTHTSIQTLKYPNNKRERERPEYIFYIQDVLKILKYNVTDCILHSIPTISIIPCSRW